MSTVLKSSSYCEVVIHYDPQKPEEYSSKWGLPMGSGEMAAISRWFVL